MKLSEKIKKKIVYSLTTKPDCYVHIDKPKSLQDLRQIQYNNWCKAKWVFNGSFLPTNPDKLNEKSKRGWIETTSTSDKTGKHRTFQRKSSGQIVDYHCRTLTAKGMIADEHYHWWVATSVKENRSVPNSEKYRDRYGQKCGKDSKESHLAPLDDDYDYK